MTGEKGQKRSLKIGLICSHGGHLTEMLELSEAFEEHTCFYFCYDASTTRSLPRAYRVSNMARNPIEFIKNIFRLWRIFRKERPDLLISTGAEIAIPALLTGKLMGIPMLYIECGAQVTTPSLTGRIMSRIATRFYVQWPELLVPYGRRARWRGSLVDEEPFPVEDTPGKRPFKVTLVQPPHTSGFSSDQPPLGLAYLASVLQLHGCVVRVIDAAAERLDLKAVLARLVQQEPDMVAVTVTTPLSIWAQELARAIRKSFSSPPICIAGGPHATVLPEELLEVGLYDYVIRGEGEATLGELVDTLRQSGDTTSIEGISYRHAGKIIHNPARPLIEDIDTLPFPDWSLFPLERYSSLARKKEFSLPIMTSRGCPHGCTFCYKGVYGKTLRMRSPESVIAEWKYLVERFGVEEIAVIDDVFTENSRRAITICEGLIKENLHTIPWSTTNGIRVSNASEKLLRALKAAGCYRVYFGAESGVQRIVDALGKNISLNKVREAVATAKKIGLEVGVYFMLGNVGEREEDMDATIRFALELDPDLVQFTIATPYPGTEMYRQIQENGEFLFSSWDQLASYGGLTFRMGELTPERVNRKYRQALHAFYFRPAFLLRQLRYITTWTGLKNRLKAAALLVRMTLLPR